MTAGAHSLGNSVEQGLDSLVLEGRSAHHGREDAVDGALSDQAPDGELIGLGALEVGHHIYTTANGSFRGGCGWIHMVGYLFYLVAIF